MPPNSLNPSCKPLTTKLQFDNLAAFKAQAGQSLGTTLWLKISQEMINQFAKVTLDEQWIHVDTEKAAQSPMGSTIAHGLLTLSLTPHLVGELYEIKSLKMGINYGMDKVRFLKPIPAESNIRMHAVVKSIEDFGEKGMKVILETTIEMQGFTKPVAYAELISVLYE